jgi:hypothetical protein
MGRYAMLDTASQIVVSVVEWDGNLNTWRPPAGHTMVEDADTVAGPGYKYEDGQFKPPPAGEPGTT